MKYPTTRQQKQFEDLAKTLLKALATLHETQQNAVFELVMEYVRENYKHEHPTK